MAECGGTRDLPRSSARFAALAVATSLVFGILGARLVQLQVIEGHDYAAQAAAAQQVELPIASVRGLIFDREGRPVAVNVPRWVVSVVPAELADADRHRVLSRLARLAGVDLAVLVERLDAYGGSPLDAVPLISGIDRETAYQIGEEQPRLSGVQISSRPERQYLGLDGTADGQLLSTILGYTGPISADELARLSASGYLSDDAIGRTGVEASFEKELRGTYGADLAERDASGAAGRVIGNARQPVPGRNLVLTIDARLQEMATRSLQWGLDAAHLESGVTIVMNPQTGEILAMVSLPAYDNNAFAAGIDPALYQSYLDNPARPLRNHAISDVYPPGSTFKLVTGLAALEEGVTTPTRKWPTYGCFPIPGASDGQCLYEWNRKGFGPLDMVDAFAFSSDTFFYQMAVKLGVDRLAKWAYQFGFGSPTGIDLPNEAGGTVASTAWARSQGRDGVYTGELAQAGIGQNVIAVTPLQLLNAYAALANGGHLMRPMVVRGYADDSGELIEPIAPQEIGTMTADPSNLQVMRVGAREVITTGHALNIRRLVLPGALSGKTGTAEYGIAAPDGSLPYHSWFVAFVPSVSGADDSTLAVITFTYRAMAYGNVSTEVVKYFLQEYFDLDQDLRYDPLTLTRISPDSP